MISVLLVDDEPALLNITRIFLEKEGDMSVTLSESAKDALERLQSGTYDIVVSDYEMPGMNGIDLLITLNSRKIDIPFIIFTGRGREHVVIEALNNGASFYLQKGGDPKSQFAELRNMIDQAVRHKKAESEVKMNKYRLEALIELQQMTNATTSEICNYALKKAIELTKSKMGYMAFLNEDETVLTLDAGSQEVMNECLIEHKKQECLVSGAGLWAEAVRQRRPVITNDYATPNPQKKGYSKGHVSLTRHMNVPILDAGKIVMLAGVANKNAGYEEADVRQVTLLMGGLWQIIKRNRAETDLIKSERRLRSYFDLPLIGIAITSPDMRWLSVNDKLCQMVGYSREELEKITWADLTPPEDLQSHLEEFSIVISGEKEAFHLEKRYRRKDNRLIDVEVSSMPVRKDDGSVDYFVAFIQDISPLKKARKELMAANEQMVATLEELRCTKNRDGDRASGNRG